MPKRSKRRLMRRVLFVAVTLFIVWCFVAWGAARWLIVNDIGNATRRGGDIEVIAVLAGSADYHARTRHAARIWNENPSARVVLTNDGERSGWLSSEQRNPLFVERAQWALEEAGVPRDRIEKLPQIVSGTHDESLWLHDYALTRDVRSMTVVTSPYHTRRARWMLKRVFGLSTISVTIDAAPPPLDDSTPAPATWWLYRHGWRNVAGEYAKFAYYAIRY